jgi:hypothetical protein
MGSPFSPSCANEAVCSDPTAKFRRLVKKKKENGYVLKLSTQFQILAPLSPSQITIHFDF